jgi:hypothetical protein
MLGGGGSEARDGGGEARERRQPGEGAAAAEALRRARWTRRGRETRVDRDRGLQVKNVRVCFAKTPPRRLFRDGGSTLNDVEAGSFRPAAPASPSGDPLLSVSSLVPVSDAQGVAAYTVTGDTPSICAELYGMYSRERAAVQGLCLRTTPSLWMTWMRTSMLYRT